MRTGVLLGVLVICGTVSGPAAGAAVFGGAGFGAAVADAAVAGAVTGGAVAGGAVAGAVTVAAVGGAAPSTAAPAGTPACEGALATADPVVVLDYEDLWTYRYSLSWCVVDGGITWVVPRVTPLGVDPRCTWVGSMEEKVAPRPGTSSWTAFNMSEFSCRVDDLGTVMGVNPWADVVVHADRAPEVVGEGVTVQR
ncbi:hypothetical protein [Saccharothrix sp. Mg75]|uniref:hypothetical protein n=1 Tax=Saccharothrix sp. Mg75 TaxID=3445357 RepID=UPI003EEB4BD4